MRRLSLQARRIGDNFRLKVTKHQDLNTLIIAQQDSCRIEFRLKVSRSHRVRQQSLTTTTNNKKMATMASMWRSPRLAGPFPKGTRQSVWSKADLRIITPNLKCVQPEKNKTERKPSLTAS